MPTAYSLLNSANTSDKALDDAVDQIVSGLFNVCATMGVVPIIRAPKDGAYDSWAVRQGDVNFNAGAAGLIAPKLDLQIA